MGLYHDPAKSELRAAVRPAGNALVLNAEAGGQGWNLAPVAAEEVRPLRHQVGDGEPRDGGAIRDEWHPLADGGGGHHGQDVGHEGGCGGDSG